MISYFNRTAYFSFGDINYQHGRSHPAEKYSTGDCVTVEVGTQNLYSYAYHSDMDNLLISYSLNGVLQGKDFGLQLHPTYDAPKVVFPAVSVSSWNKELSSTRTLGKVLTSLC